MADFFGIAATPPPTPITTPPTSTTSTSTLNNAAIANTNKSLALLPDILAHALAANDQSFQNAQHGFDVQEQQQRGQYNDGTTTNQNNYDANTMASLRAGAQGLGGLLSILRGTGVEGWANNVVRDTTNSDIRNGADTRQQNQTALDTSLSSFLSDLADKRHSNEVTHQNNEFASRKDNATQLQDLYTKMAQYYADNGDNATATDFMNKAGDQSQAIARYGVAPVGKYDMSPVTVKAPEISAFAAPTQQSINYNGGDTGTGGIFTIGDARKRLAGAGA